MVLKPYPWPYDLFQGLEEDEITWFSNSKRFSECCTVGLADVKLHGAQTGFLRCADEFPAWKGELHGTQTHRNIQETTNLVWKKVKLHGTQTHATLWWKITEPSNSVTRSYGALEKGKIAWYSNISCMANQISPLWRRVKSYGSQINRAQYFCVHFYLKGTKKS